VVDLDFWQDLSDYCNFNWRGKFSDAEIRDTAELYQEEWMLSIKKHILSITINNVLNNLRKDRANGSDEAEKYIIEILRNCDKHQIKYE